MNNLRKSTCCERLSYVEEALEELRQLVMMLTEKIESLEEHFVKEPYHEEPEITPDDTYYDDSYPYDQDYSDESPNDMD